MNVWIHTFLYLGANVLKWDNILPKRVIGFNQPTVLRLVIYEVLTIESADNLTESVESNQPTGIELEKNILAETFHKTKQMFDYADEICYGNVQPYVGRRHRKCIKYILFIWAKVRFEIQDFNSLTSLKNWGTGGYRALHLYKQVYKENSIYDFISSNYSRGKVNAINIFNRIIGVKTLKPYFTIEKTLTYMWQEMVGSEDASLLITEMKNSLVRNTGYKKFEQAHNAVALRYPIVDKYNENMFCKNLTYYYAEKYGYNGDILEKVFKERSGLKNNCNQFVHDVLIHKYSDVSKFCANFGESMQGDVCRAKVKAIVRDQMDVDVLEKFMTQYNNYETAIEKITRIFKCLKNVCEVIYDSLAEQWMTFCVKSMFQAIADDHVTEEIVCNEKQFETRDPKDLIRHWKNSKLVAKATCMLYFPAEDDCNCYNELRKEISKTADIIPTVQLIPKGLKNSIPRLNCKQFKSIVNRNVHYELLRNVVQMMLPQDQDAFEQFLNVFNEEFLRGTRVIFLPNKEQLYDILNLIKEEPKNVEIFRNYETFLYINEDISPDFSKLLIWMRYVTEINDYTGSAEMDNIKIFFSQYKEMDSTDFSRILLKLREDIFPIYSVKEIALLFEQGKTLDLIHNLERNHLLNEKLNFKTGKQFLTKLDSKKERHELISVMFYVVENDMSFKILNILMKDGEIVYNNLIAFYHTITIVKKSKGTLNNAQFESLFGLLMFFYRDSKFTEEKEFITAINILTQHLQYDDIHRFLSFLLHEELNLKPEGFVEIIKEFIKRGSDKLNSDLLDAIISILKNTREKCMSIWGKSDFVNKTIDECVLIQYQSCIDQPQQCGTNNDYEEPWELIIIALQTVSAETKLICANYPRQYKLCMSEISQMLIRASISNEATTKEITDLQTARYELLSYKDVQYFISEKWPIKEVENILRSFQSDESKRCMLEKMLHCVKRGNIYREWHSTRFRIEFCNNFAISPHGQKYEAIFNEIILEDKMSANPMFIGHLEDIFEAVVIISFDTVINHQTPDDLIKEYLKLVFRFFIKYKDDSTNSIKSENVKNDLSKSLQQYLYNEWDFRNVIYLFKFGEKVGLSIKNHFKNILEYKNMLDSCWRNERCLFYMYKIIKVNSPVCKIQLLWTKINRRDRTSRLIQRVATMYGSFVIYFAGHKELNLKCKPLTNYWYTVLLKSDFYNLPTYANEEDRENQLDQTSSKDELLAQVFEELSRKKEDYTGNATESARIGDRAIKKFIKNVAITKFPLNALVSFLKHDNKGNCWRKFRQNSSWKEALKDCKTIQKPTAMRVVQLT